MTFFTPDDFLIIGFIVFLEGILSIDNALVLALLAKPLPKKLQKKALLYGLAGAVFFRIIAIFLASLLIKWRWIKYLGGGYLVWIGLKHLLSKSKDQESKNTKPASFWKTVLIIELTDIAFAVDSILAAVALTSKVWLIVFGGIIGLVLMRFAAGIFLKLLDRFPRFESTAYLLIVLIGSKLIIEGLELPFINFHTPSSPSFIIFWAAMTLTLLSGFLQSKTKKS